MSKSVVPAAAVAHAKHLVNNKKLIKRTEGQKPADTDKQAVDHKEEAANVADVRDAQQHATSMSDAVLSDFSFAGALSSAASSSSSSLAAEGAQSEGGYSDDDNDGSGTIVAIGAAGLAILGGVVAFGGGGGSKNKPPTVSAATQTITINEDAAATAVTVSASDPNTKDTLTYTASGATKGTVAGGTNGAFTYTPNKDANGTDTFTVTVSDGKGGTATQTVTVNITPVNDAPVVADKATATTKEDTALTGSVGATDVDNATLTYTVATNAANGTVTVGADGKYTYTPKADFNGSDTFTIKVSDGTAANDKTQTVTVTVTAEPDAPRADAENTKALTVAEDTAGEIIVAFTDPDAPTDINLKFALTDQPDNGKLTTNAAGNLVYTPNQDFNGTDSITYTITDNNGGTTTQKVDITVTAVNDAPVLGTIANLTAVDGAASFTPAATDVDSTTLTFAATDPAGGAVTKNADGSFTYKADAGFSGTDTFTVTVSDGDKTDSQVVSVQVGPSVITTSLDVGTPTTTATVALVGESDYILTDDASVQSFVIVTGFEAGDQIKVTKATSGDYNFTTSPTDQNDVVITFNSGVVNEIILDEVVADGTVIFNLATAQTALGANFITFG